jgi:hypothetical protein
MKEQPIELMAQWIHEEIRTQESQSTEKMSGRSIVEAVAAKRFPDGVDEPWVKRCTSIVDDLLTRFDDPSLPVLEEADHFQTAVEPEVDAGREPNDALRQAHRDVVDRLQAEGEKKMRQAQALRELTEHQARLQGGTDLA